MGSTAYSFGYSAEVLKSHASRTVDNTCGFFVKDVPADARVLDAGCGPGTITSSFARLIPNGSIIGVDISEDVIAKARAQDDVPSNCSFQAADITKLPFDNDTFDVIYTSQALGHIPAAEAALKELRRVCKPGGFVACREGDTSATIVYPRHPGLKLWHKVLSATVEVNNGHPSSISLLWSWALAAGFTEDKLKFGIGSILYTPRERQFWGQTMYNRCKNDNVWRQKSLATGLIQSEEDFALMEEGWLAFANDPAAIFVMPCGEIVCYK